jgi:hypothetical protein
MKKIVILLHMLIFMQSCGFNIEHSGYNFDNFKKTPVWNLAKAVRADDATEVTRILKNQKLEIDFKDPEYQQTLLALSIQNDKKNAFLALLKAGANPNLLLGNPADSTPFIYGIETTTSLGRVSNCDLFYVKSMLQFGADPNLEIKNPQEEYYFENSFPLLAAVHANTARANECLDLIKLLVDIGADINCCYRQPDSEICEGVLAVALSGNSMEILKYFVIEKKIAIPDTVFITGELDKLTQEAFSLREILTSKYYKYEDFESETGKHDRSQMRKTRDEILEYLDKIGK